MWCLTIRKKQRITLSHFSALCVRLQRANQDKRANCVQPLATLAMRLHIIGIRICVNMKNSIILGLVTNRVYNRVVAHNVAVIALGIDQPFLVVMRAFFQIGKRDSFFALTVSLGDATMSRLGAGIQINHGVHAVLANELAIPFCVDIVFDVLDDAVVVEHIHEYVLVSTERPLNDDDFTVRV